MDQFLAFVIEILLMSLGESLSVKASPKSLAAKRVAENAAVGCALAFILGIASVYFFPMLALREPVWQLFNALLSPLVAGIIIVLLKRKANARASNLPEQSERAVLLQAFAVGLSFNLTRLLFGH